ncbi:MAG: SUMF1/EgtB/PvdO family nonheme iron enzyme [Acidobacteriia bacterium]|nr:SUMF1/EgtB/PvdO family nonheme iron enzyme [Terriglobia bacterium]
MTTPSTEQPLIALLNSLQEARDRTLELIADLTDEQMIGPRLDIVNPLRWEIGHVGWFQEYWVLRHYRKQKPTLADRDRLYDSAAVAHDTRWDLVLPSKAETVAYIQGILERVMEREGAAGSRPQLEPERYDETYFIRLALLHEYMHAEAITYTRQTLGYPPPKVRVPQHVSDHGALSQSPGGENKERGNNFGVDLGDAEIAGGASLLGSTPDMGFVFDNEQWVHPVTINPFHMARAAVSNAEFGAFVDDNGYKRRDLWTNEGWQWRESAQAEHPVYWQKQRGGRWLRRNFDTWVSLEPRLPVLHVNWYEADAYCRWAGRRLPSELEWEFAASAGPALGGDITQRRRLFPWGNEPPSPDRANLDWRAMGCVDVDALPAGDSAFGCRQLVGNVWEWTATDFGPYPEFSPGPYKEYSAPWFGDHKVLRGGCWVTRSGLIRNQYRNFYQPHRRDVWAGFRTCALSEET